MTPDDPALAVQGTLEECVLEVDVVLAWWLALGIRMSWPKGSFTDGSHEWIGIQFEVEGASVIMSLTPDFVASVMESLRPFLRHSGVASLSQARTLVGKVARIAQVVPEATPYAASLWGALTASEKVMAASQLEAPPGMVAVRRFYPAAGWFKALLPFAMFPLRRRVYSTPAAWRLGWSRHSIELDASPWGGGAVLFYDRQPIEYLICVWDDALFSRFSAVRGESKWQSLWEFVTVLIALIVWGHLSTDQVLVISCDNIAALADALALRGRGDMNAVAQEIAWRKAILGWHLDAKHIPSEMNDLADALSRSVATPPRPFPEILRQCVMRTAPPLDVMWQAWVDDPPPIDGLQRKKKR